MLATLLGSLIFYLANKEIKKCKINLEFTQEEIKRLKVKLNELKNKKALLYSRGTPRTFKIEDRLVMDEIYEAMEKDYQEKRAKGKKEY